MSFAECETSTVTSADVYLVSGSDVVTVVVIAVVVAVVAVAVAVSAD